MRKQARRAVVFMVPGRLDTRTGGSIYDRRLVEGLRARSWTVDVLELGEGFPCPAPATRHRAAQVLAAVPAESVVVIDGLTLGAISDTVAREATRLRLVALVHLPLAADVSIGHEAATRLEAAERLALGAARLVVVSGEATLPLLGPYSLNPARVVVIEPGTDPAPVARGSSGSRLELLSVATINAIKGHEGLLTALAAMPHRDWHVVCAGSLTRDPATTDRVRNAITRLDLQRHVSLVGELDDPALAACYDHADVFVLATRQETYGMAVAEALARGLPVVSTTTGAIPDLVGRDAGVLVPPGDTQALSAALGRVLGDAGLRARLAEGAQRVRAKLPSWDQAVGEMESALESLDAHA